MQKPNSYYLLHRQPPVGFMTLCAPLKYTVNAGVELLLLRLWQDHGVRSVP